ncbi:hypothetical protein [Acinetobacter baumannii]|uniref:hypothetical protein n=1 Tax=Acinetobacter baumannii TaxID=470 RepID=UPI003AF7C58E
MSLVFRSDKASTNNFGTYESITTTPEQAFTAYKARVEADGGIIQNETVTLLAFKFLVSNGLLGAARTWISSYFGLKLSGTSIIKAYSLGGQDLVSVVFGTGTLPSLTADGIKFNNLHTDTVNGAILSSENKISLNGKGTILGLRRFAQVPSRAGETLLGALTLHNETNNSSPLFFLTSPSNSNTQRFRIQSGIPDQNNTVATQYSNIDVNTVVNPDTFYLFRTSENSASLGYRNGLAVTFPAFSQSNFSGLSAYIDFGGGNWHVSGSPSRRFSDAIIKHFFMFDDVTEAQAEALAKLTL